MASRVISDPHRNSMRRQDLERLVPAHLGFVETRGAQPERAVHPMARRSERPKPVVENVIIAYLPQNNPPVVRSITVSTQAAAPGSQKSSSSSATSAATASR